MFMGISPCLLPALMMIIMIIIIIIIFIFCFFICRNLDTLAYYYLGLLVQHRLAYDDDDDEIVCFTVR